MAVLSITADFEREFRGTLATPLAVVPIGTGDGRLEPYDMLLGALASCYYANFLDIADKKRLSFSSASIAVSGEKRSEIPATLSWVKLRVTVRGSGQRDANAEKGFRDAAELAGKYCSIYQTLSKVADMATEFVFEG